MGRCSHHLLKESKCAEELRTQDQAQALRIPEPGGVGWDGGGGVAEKNTANPAPSRWRLAEPFPKGSAPGPGRGCLPSQLARGHLEEEEGETSPECVKRGLQSFLPEGSLRSLFVFPGACLHPPLAVIGPIWWVGVFLLAGGRGLSLARAGAGPPPR